MARALVLTVSLAFVWALSSHADDRPSGVPSNARWVKVDRVTDGDTIVLMDRTRVRLHGIDAPERDQPSGPIATAALEYMVARAGITGWLIEKVLAFMIWWNGPVTFQELRLSADRALSLDNPSAADGVRMFSKWMAHSYYADDLDISGVITTFGRLGISDAVARAYEAPYPSGEYKAGVHVLASLIPTQLPENEHYGRAVYERWDKPFLVTFGSEERITIRMKQEFMDRVPNPIDIDLHGVGHFSPEEAGPELSSLLNKFIAGQLDQANSLGDTDRY